MGFQMSCVDHQPFKLSATTRQFYKYLIVHPKAAPAHKTVVDRLVRVELAWSIAPAQAILNDVDDPADNAPVVNPRNPVR